MEARNGLQECFWGGDFPGAARENGGGPRTHRWSLLGTSLPFGGSTAVVGAFLFDLEGFQSLATTAQTPPTLIRKILLLQLFLENVVGDHSLAPVGCAPQCWDFHDCTAIES